jgi:excisionase family DNA binding protein
MSRQRDLMHERGYLSASEVATVTGVHLSTVHRLALAGELEHTRMGRQWYITISSVEKRWPAVSNDARLKAHKQ